jgi:hypothetical protein
MKTVSMVVLAAAVLASGDLHADGAHAGAKVTTLIDRNAPLVLPPAPR